MVKGKCVDLRKVSETDAEFILSLRLNEEINKYLSPTENDLEKQKAWIKECLKKNDQWYFIIQNKKNEPVGTIRIYDINENSFCWGSWIVISEARKYASFESSVLLYDYAFYELGFAKSHFDVRKDNKHVVNFHLNFNAHIVNEDELNYFFIFEEKEFALRRAEYAATIEKIANRYKIE